MLPDESIGRAVLLLVNRRTRVWFTGSVVFEAACIADVRIPEFLHPALTLQVLRLGVGA